MSHTDATMAGDLRPARRTIVKGAAWAVPAVAIAAPASAASCSSPVSAIGCGNACKHTANGSGRRFYHFVFCFTNTCDTAVTVAVDDVSIGGVAREAMLNCQPPGSGPAGCPTFVVPAGGTLCKHIDAGRFPADTAGEALLTWRYLDPATGNWVEATPTGSGVTVGETLPDCAWPNPPHDRPDPSSCGAVIAGSNATSEEPAAEAPTVADTESSTASPQG